MLATKPWHCLQPQEIKKTEVPLPDSAGQVQFFYSLLFAYFL